MFGILYYATFFGFPGGEFLDQCFGDTRKINCLFKRGANGKLESSTILVLKTLQ